MGLGSHVERSRRRDVRRHGGWSRLAGLGLMVVAGVVAGGQEPVAMLPNNYRLVLDNSAVSVIRTHYAPHEKIPVHDHQAVATVFVFLNDGGAMRIDHPEKPDEANASVTRPALEKGGFRVAAAVAERHSIENLGETSTDFVRVELKQVPLELKEPFVGKAPQNMTAPLDALEFTDVGLMVERIICAGTAACPVKLSSMPSLIVALTPVAVAEGGEKSEKVAAGGVHWLNAAQDVSVAATDPAGTAQVVRIVFPPLPAK